MIRVPKPSYILSQLRPSPRPDVALRRVLDLLAERYQLGEVKTCRRARPSLSLNFIVNTSQGQFVCRRHHLTEDAMAYEYQVLDHLQQRGFPAPRLLLNRAGRAWTMVNGAFYGVYEFVDGYCPTDFLWSPAAQRRVIAWCGRTLAEYHQAIANLVPSTYKWNGYRPAEHKRWREGDWFRRLLSDIRLWLQSPSATSSFDDWVRFRIDAIDDMLELEPVVEERSDLSKLVIHGDYSPWNVLFRPGQSPVVLDFGESRLDLKIYDIVLATFWFAWRGNRLDQDKALAFQAGYGGSAQLREVDMRLAAPVFRWIMARSLIERLHKFYRGQCPSVKGPEGLEQQYQMCVWAVRQPQHLVAGLRGAAAR
jgi:Ser/Thr protein kinase RdoA (MazF antagonist)